MNGSGHDTIKRAVKQEIEEMTTYSPDSLICVGKYSYRRLNDLVEERIKTKWCKRRSKNFKGVSVYELLARTLYFESSQNNKGAKTRRNEIITFYKVVRARMWSNRFKQKKMKDVLMEPGQFCGLTSFAGKKKSQKGYAKIKINNKKISLSWVRSVVVATVAERNPNEKYTSKSKYPYENDDYYYWHSKEDWKKFTDSTKTKIRFVGNDKYYNSRILNNNS